MIPAPLRDLARLGGLALALVITPFLGALVLVHTAPGWLGPLDSLPIPLALASYLGAAALLSGLSLIPTHAASLVGGLLFGAVLGSFAALAAVVGAAALGFWLLRRVVGDRALRSLARRPRARRVHEALVQGGGGRTVGLIALVRLSPVMPFAGTNLLMASAACRPRDFLLGSALGLAPRVVLVAVLGAGLGELDLSRGADRRLALAGLMATAVALVWITALCRRTLRRQLPAAAPAPTPTPASAPTPASSPD